MSLQQYLNRRYMAVSSILVVVFIFLISFMNWLGMDDTTEYYMLYEAEVLTEHYKPYSPIAEFDSGVKEYYWGHAGLPTQYKVLMARKPLPPNRATLITVPSGYVYILPYISTHLDITFYVVHWFPLDEFAGNNERLRLTVSGFAVGLLLLVLGFVLWSNRRVSKELTQFDLWLKQIGTRPLSNPDDHPLPESISFAELKASSETIINSLVQQAAMQRKQAQLLQREKEFLASLSHELRTPIAVIAAAIGLMRKRDQLPEKEQKVLEKLAKANANMKLLTTTILQVWRKQEGPAQAQTFDLTEAVEAAVEECRTYCRSELEFELAVTANQVMHTDLGLVSIVLNNLLRNACQYADDDMVRLTLNGPCFAIANGYASEVRSTHEAQPYGYGFGLYLVETICQQQGWGLEVCKAIDNFRVDVTFVNGLDATAKPVADTTSESEVTEKGSQ